MDSSRGRVSSQTLSGNRATSADVNDPSQLRPLPRARDFSPMTNQRRPSLDPVSSSGNQSPRTRSRSPGVTLRTASATQNYHGLQQGKSPSGTPSFPPSNTPPFAPSFNSPFDLQGTLISPLPPRIGDPNSYSPAHSRVGSRSDFPVGSRPNSPGPGLNTRPLTPTETKSSKRKSWLPAKLQGRSQSGSKPREEPLAWLIGPSSRVVYNLSFLTTSQVPELWDVRGDTFVYLFPKASSHGPSFRIRYSSIASSRTLTSFAEASPMADNNHQEKYPSEPRLSKHMRQTSLGVPSTLPPSLQVSLPPRRVSSINSPSEGGLSSWSEDDHLNDNEGEDAQSEYHLFMPLGINPIDPSAEIPPDDIENLVAVRNLFAFLIGENLIGTPGQPTAFAVLSNLSRLLRHYEFSNLDESTLGEVASASFNFYADHYGLADVRASREKTLEAIVIAERMKNWELYNEGFVHGVGKWDEIMNLNSPIFQLIGELTRKRMERAFNDLTIRRRSVETRLKDFDFPSLFAGIANSSVDNKEIDFKSWKSSFFSMRRHALGLYKLRYGSWPPKAKSKKNQFEESGLNRLLLQEVYHDFSDLYDILVNRKEMTTRTADFLLHDGSSTVDPNMPSSHVLRKLLSEFDRSSPPVQPPIPFDTPILPDLRTTRRDFSALPEKKQAKERKKKLKDNEINQALLQAVNRESVKATPFVESFLSFERESARGKSIEEIVNLRIGQWIFMYVVLQSLPLVVTDAPGLKYTDGVEYFLCEVPKGGVPWNKEDLGAKKAWYGVPGGSALVSLPADVVEHGVDGIYRRSHCWQQAENWTNSAGLIDQVTGFNSESLPDIGLSLPPHIDPDAAPGSQVSSPGRTGSSRNSVSSVTAGLEALPLPSGAVPSGSLMTPAIFDPTKSFENILGESALPKKKKR